MKKRAESVNIPETKRKKVFDELIIEYPSAKNSTTKRKRFSMNIFY